MLGASVRLLGHLNLRTGEAYPLCCGGRLDPADCWVMREEERKVWVNHALCARCGRSYFNITGGALLTDGH